MNKLKLMENCTIYSHELDFEKIVEIVKNELPKANVEVSENGLQKSLIATIKNGFFSKTRVLKINYRSRQTPSYNLDNIDCGLSQNLASMTNYIQLIPSKNEAVCSKFVMKVMSTNCEMPVIIEPTFDDQFITVVKKITFALDGFVFAHPLKSFPKAKTQHFLDKNLNLILDLEGNCEISDIDVVVNSKYADKPETELTEDQLKRKEKTAVFLTEHDIKSSKTLPCVASESETEIRTTKEVIDRVFALMLIAVKGEGCPQEDLEKAKKDKKVDSFTTYENYIFDKSEFEGQEQTDAIWRYESLNTMLWALGFVEELSYPDQICDAGFIVGLCFTPTRTEFETKAKLRSKTEILDELDKIYRMHWACVDARIKDETISGYLNGSIIYERHYSLNWLTKHQNQDWDDVTTNT